LLLPGQREDTLKVGQSERTITLNKINTELRIFFNVHISPDASSPSRTKKAKPAKTMSCLQM